MRVAMPNGKPCGEPNETDLRPLAPRVVLLDAEKHQPEGEKMTTDTKSQAPLFVPPPRKPIDPEEPDLDYYPDGDWGSDEIEISRSHRYD